MSAVLASPSLEGDQYWQRAAATMHTCPACGERDTYNLDGDCYCTACCFDGAEDHEERKRRRLAIQNEY